MFNFMHDVFTPEQTPFRLIDNSFQTARNFLRQHRVRKHKAYLNKIAILGVEINTQKKTAVIIDSQYLHNNNS